MSQLVNTLISSPTLAGHDSPHFFFGQQVTLVIGVFAAQCPSRGPVPPGTGFHPSALDVLDHPQTVTPQELGGGFQPSHQTALNLDGFVIAAHIVSSP
jgi:hypothetical protein